MTLYEYENQKDPQKLPAGTVILNPEQYTITHDTPDGKYVKVTILGRTIRYATVRGGSVLYTIDDNTGLRKNPSCFAISI